MILRRARLQDLSTILDWAADEGWNPGRDDAAAFWATDPDGFFVAEAEGRPVASVSVVNHSAGQAFLGCYLCRPDWRGRGVGLALWNHALPHAGDRSIGLDGVAAQQANYARSGFVRVGSTQRFTGQLDPVLPAHVRPAATEDLAWMTALDALANGHDRAAFLKAWVQPSPSRMTMVLADGTGFATARLCRSGAKAGPVIAKDAQTAVDLVRAALHAVGEPAVMIDLPSSNRPLSDLLQAQGFQPGFATARMVKGPPPQPTARLQAIATMELG